MNESTATPPPAPPSCATCGREFTPTPELPGDPECPTCAASWGSPS
jgi:hypothetical protein